MATIPELVALALEHHHHGRLEAAEQVYRQILEIDSNQPNAYHLLGVIARQSDRLDESVELISRAIRMKGNVADFHNNLAAVYLEQKKLPEAIACYRRVIQLKPDDALAYSNLGSALRDVGQLSEAADCCRRAVRLNFELVEAHINLGNVLSDQGKADIAIASYNRALERNPHSSFAHNNLGNALKKLGKFDAAIASYQRAIEIDPDFAEVYSNIGNVLKDQGKLDEAVQYYSRAFELKPNSLEACTNLGNALADQGKLDEAISCCRQAIALKPDFPMAHNNLGNALKAQGNLEGAIECYRRVLQLTPNNLEVHSNLLFTRQYCDGITLKELYDAHAEYDRLHNTAITAPIIHQKTATERIRAGFVSADLGRHPVGYYLISIFEALKHESIETICYSDRLVKDEMTARFQAAATQWHESSTLTDDQLAAQIRSDKIDILFDLSGHTAHNRLPVFARKPAPIQISWIGYEGTTGLKAMDYLIADQRLIPIESEQYYHEKILRMCDGYVCYEPPESAPPVSPLPLETIGYPTFGSFNNLSKMTPHVIEVWSKLLQRLPDARLMLKYRGLGDAGTQQKYRDAFAANGIDTQRLDLLPPTSYADYLAAYHQIDVALDPFPFNGGATTCESLWMGVPVVTCPLETFASRHTLSHLSNIGLTELIARDFNDYIEIAVSLVNDPQRLAQIRSGLRERMKTSPLCDGRRFATDLVTLLQNLHA